MLTQSLSDFTANFVIRSAAPNLRSCQHSWISDYCCQDGTTVKSVPVLRNACESGKILLSQTCFKLNLCFFFFLLVFTTRKDSQIPSQNIRSRRLSSSSLKLSRNFRFESDGGELQKVRLKCCHAISAVIFGSFFFILPTIELIISLQFFPFHSKQSHIYSWGKDRKGNLEGWKLMTVSAAGCWEVPAKSQKLPVLSRKLLNESFQNG